MKLPLLLSLSLLVATSAVAAEKKIALEVGFEDESYSVTESHLTYGRSYRTEIPVITTSASAMHTDSRFTPNHRECLQHMTQAFLKSRQYRNLMPIIDKATFRIARARHSMKPIWPEKGRVTAEFPPEERGRHVVLHLGMQANCGAVSPETMDAGIAKALKKTGEEHAAKARAADAALKEHNAIIRTLRQLGVGLGTDGDGAKAAATRSEKPASRAITTGATGVAESIAGSAGYWEGDLKE